jgi:hypothetical protein
MISSRIDIKASLKDNKVNDPTVISESFQLTNVIRANKVGTSNIDSNENIITTGANQGVIDNNIIDTNENVIASETTQLTIDNNLANESDIVIQRDASVDTANTKADHFPVNKYYPFVGNIFGVFVELLFIIATIVIFCITDNSNEGITVLLSILLIFQVLSICNIQVWIIKYFPNVNIHELLKYHLMCRYVLVDVFGIALIIITEVIRRVDLPKDIDERVPYVNLVNFFLGYRYLYIVYLYSVYIMHVILLSIHHLYMHEYTLDKNEENLTYINWLVIYMLKKAFCRPNNFSFTFYFEFQLAKLEQTYTGKQIQIQLPV